MFPKYKIAVDSNSFIKEKNHDKCSINQNKAIYSPFAKIILIVFGIRSQK